MNAAFRHMRVFLSLTGIWWLAGILIITLTDKQALHLWFNQFHHDWSDLFFRYATHLGDGVFGAFIVLLALIYRIRIGVIGLIGLAGSGLFTQLLKRQVFYQEKRPSKVFEQLSEIHFVDGIDLHGSFSFPSGHATAAFAIFFLLAIIGQQKIYQVLAFVFACVIAFSRVYISQHFFEDILAGSAMGVGVTFIAYAFLHDKSWGQKGLIDLIDRHRPDEDA